MTNSSQNSSAVSVFQFQPSFDVRVIVIDGNPWFVAGDVAAALEYRDAANMTRFLDDDEKGTHNVSTPSGNQQMTVINESGLYSAILKSRKPEAKKFKKWVTSEVLPSIRKTGSYTIPQPPKPSVEPISPKQYRELSYMVDCIANAFHLKQSAEWWAWRVMRELSGGLPAANMPVVFFPEAQRRLKDMAIESSKLKNGVFAIERAFMRNNMKELPHELNALLVQEQGKMQIDMGDRFRHAINTTI